MHGVIQSPVKTGGSSMGKFSVSLIRCVGLVFICRRERKYNLFLFLLGGCFLNVYTAGVYELFS